MLMNKIVKHQLDYFNDSIRIKKKIRVTNRHLKERLEENKDSQVQS